MNQNRVSVLLAPGPKACFPMLAGSILLCILENTWIMFFLRSIEAVYFLVITNSARRFWK